jgi:hypothetical protein
VQPEIATPSMMTEPRHPMGLSASVPRFWLKALLTPWVRAVAALAFVASFFLPITGLGVDLCPLHSATGLPCPGCGVTRGLSLISQGDVWTAMGANPFVILLWPFLAVLAVLALVPTSRVLALEASLDHLEPWFSRLYRVLFLAFFGFGFGRLLVHLVFQVPFP